MSAGLAADSAARVRALLGWARRAFEQGLAIPAPALDDDAALCREAERVRPVLEGVAGRLTTMDLMGIERQLIFPQVALAAPAWSDHPSAGAVLREYNDAVLRWTQAGSGRLRPTALLNLTTIEGEALRESPVPSRTGPRIGGRVGSEEPLGPRGT